jgi:hypothetical protein
VQSSPQLTPTGVLPTDPLPEPAFVTVSAKPFSANVAVTLRASLIVTVHDPVPVQAPLQPVNVESFADVAVSVTLVPLA